MATSQLDEQSQKATRCSQIGQNYQILSGHLVENPWFLATPEYAAFSAVLGDMMGKIAGLQVTDDDIDFFRLACIEASGAISTGPLNPQVLRVLELAIANEEQQ